MVSFVPSFPSKTMLQHEEALKRVQLAQLEESLGRQNLLKSCFKSRGLRNMTVQELQPKPCEASSNNNNAFQKSFEASCRHCGQSFPKDSMGDKLEIVDCYMDFANLFWKSSLAFCPYIYGDRPIEFSALWPFGEELSSLLLCTLTITPLGWYLMELAEVILWCGLFGPLKTLVDLKFTNRGQSLRDGNTPLHYACLSRHTDIGLYLLTNGDSTSLTSKASMSPTNDKGLTAAQVCFEPTLQKFLASVQSKKKPEQAPTNGKRAIDISTIGKGDAKNVITNGKIGITEEERRALFKSLKSVHSFNEFLHQLQSLEFNVNEEHDENGDGLIHLATRLGVSHVPILLLLVKQFGADINSLNSSGLTSLMIAVQSDNCLLIDTLLCVFGANPNIVTTKSKQTALHLACETGNIDAVNILLKRGADMNVEDERGALPDNLAFHSNATVCQKLIGEMRIQRQNWLTHILLKNELKSSNLRLTDLYFTDSDDSTLIMLAVNRGCCTSLDALLRVKNAPIDAQHVKTGRTALLTAAVIGNEQIVSMLLKHNANVAIADMAGYLPLHYAVQKNNFPVVDAILNCSVAPTGLHQALMLSTSAEISQRLRAAQAKRQEEFVTPQLFSCALTGDAQKLYCLLEEGDLINSTDGVGSWPLHLAVENGHMEVLELLYKKGGDIHRRHQLTKNTVLHVAAARGHLCIVHFLLEKYRSPQSGNVQLRHCSPINKVNAEGKTPLMLAGDRGYVIVVQALLDAGASTSLLDTSGELYKCDAYGGIQVLIDNHRGARTRLIMDAIREKKGLKKLKENFAHPFDHNLRDSYTKDTPLILACHQGRIDVVQFLLSSAVYPRHSDTPSGKKRNSQNKSGQILDSQVSSDTKARTDLSPKSHDLSVHNHQEPSNKKSKGKVESRDSFLESSEIFRNSSLRYNTKDRRLSGRSETAGKNSEAIDHRVSSGFYGDNEDSATTDKDTEGEETLVRRTKNGPSTNRWLSGEESPRGMDSDVDPVSLMAARLATDRRLRVGMEDGSDEESEEEVFPDSIAMFLDSVSCAQSKSSIYINETTVSHISAKNSRTGHTAYHRAIEAPSGNLAMLDLLLYLDPAACNLQDRDGLTPLHLACRLGKIKIVERLITLPFVDVNCRTLDGKLPEEMNSNKKIEQLMTKSRGHQLERKQSSILTFPTTLLRSEAGSSSSRTDSVVDFDKYDAIWAVHKPWR